MILTLTTIALFDLTLGNIIFILVLGGLTIGSILYGFFHRGE